MGAKETVLTDQVTEGAASNLAANVVSAPELAERCHVSKLSWGAEDKYASVGSLPFDVIVGSDVTYEPQSHHALLSTLEILAQAHPRGARVILAAPDHKQRTHGLKPDPVPCNLFQEAAFDSRLGCPGGLTRYRLMP